MIFEWSMLEIARLIGGSDCFELDFLEREATPESAMKLGIRLLLAELPLSYTVSILDMLGGDSYRSTVHNWVQMAGLQPAEGANLDHVADDETVIQLNDEQYWLYAAVDPATNSLLHVRLCPTRTSAISSMFLDELREKHRIDDAVFSIKGAPWMQAACYRHGLRFQHETHGNRNSIERVIREVKY